MGQWVGWVANRRLYDAFVESLWTGKVAAAMQQDTHTSWQQVHIHSACPCLWLSHGRRATSTRMAMTCQQRQLSCRSGVLPARAAG